MDSILLLEEIRKEHAPDVGGKAASLARLAQAGFPVPRGFCIPAGAYRAHVDGITRSVRGDPSDEALDELRSAIAERPLSDALLAEIGEAFARLDAPLVVVRSSATAEDGEGRSFAGLYDSFPGVAGSDGLCRSLTRCWASLWSSRACRYRRRSGIPHSGEAMAVIVQEQVNADASGVIFTADPAGGAAGRLVIEACRGTAEALVSGRIAPQRIVLTRRGLRLVSRDEGPLDEGAARRLARLALRAEALFGAPQDVEWAIRDGALFIVQARPVTAGAADSRRIWTNTNVGEVLPGVVTPLTWSMMSRAIELLFNENLRRLGIDFGDALPIARIAGRGYFDLTLVTAMLHKVPGMQKYDMGKLFGGYQERLLEGLSVDGRVGDVKVSVRYGRLLKAIPWVILQMLHGSRKRMDALLGALREKSAALMRLDRAAMDEERLLAALTESLEEIFAATQCFVGVVAGINYFSALKLLSERWLGDSAGALPGRLLAATGALDSAAPGLALAELASLVRSVPALAAAIGEERPFGEVRAALQATEGAGGFLEKWDAFMENHGHHCRGELEVANPRWMERPDYILGIVRAYARDGMPDPLAAEREKAAQRRACVIECLGKLRNPLARALFRHVLSRTEWGLAVRERFKSEAVRYLAAARLIILELGARFAARGALARDDDIFFLHYDELERVVHRRGDFDAATAVALRRGEHEKHLTLRPPPVIVGEFDENAPPCDDLPADARVLRGQTVSAGAARGPARVVREGDAEVVVRPGEILVIPFADPGWTPCFIPAAGIVMDLGGVLSHGCIIAREYGIPAVVNVGHATKLIRDGQLVHVDADRGIVTILDSTEQEA